MIAFEAWRSFPFAFLFLTARLQAVPGTLEEAAHVDGATPTQRFRYVVLPQLLPTIAVLSVLRFIWTFNSFDDIYLLTGGGAGTEVVSVRVFNALTARGDIGVASAQALVLAFDPRLPRHPLPAPVRGPRRRRPDGDDAAAGSAIGHSRRRDAAPGLDPRLGGAARLRRAALGGHRLLAAGDDLSLLLHRAAVDPPPRRGPAGPGGAVGAADRVGARQLSQRCSRPRRPAGRAS